MALASNLNRWIALGAAGAIAGVGAVAQRRHTQRLAADPEAERLREPPRGHPATVTSADGTELHAEVFGPDDGPTVVLVHGWTEMLSFWTFVIDDLVPRGFRIVAYDLRGHGDSGQASGGDFTLTRFGEDLEAVLAHFLGSGERAVVAGHSLGAMSIAAWVEHHDVPARASAAAMLNTGVGDLIAEQLLVPVPAVAQAINHAVAVHGVLGSKARLPRFSTPVSSAAVRYVAFDKTASPGRVAFFERMLVACPPDVRANVGIAMSEMDLHHALERLTIPTLVVAGEHDRLTPPSHARKISGMLPEPAGLIILRDTAHMAPLERPREISDALAALSQPARDEARTARAS